MQWKTKHGGGVKAELIPSMQSAEAGWCYVHCRQQGKQTCWWF